eukprot:TRINITY_DN9891_c0_g1_i2.p1 TRINITY_DN9891_c0_g1~~TRINITY_DN9891_c0_g1_i2.p1  ORF type:complete len:300 (+),score=33.18 TRINITY_DN9891_c0_g1_i2:136-1035(+)
MERQQMHLKYPSGREGVPTPETLVCDGATLDCLEQKSFQNATISQNRLWHGGTLDNLEDQGYQKVTISLNLLSDGRLEQGFPSATSSHTVSRGGRTLHLLQHDLIISLRTVQEEMASRHQPVFIRDIRFVQVGIRNTTNINFRAMCRDTRPYGAVLGILSTVDALEAVIASVRWEPGALDHQRLHHVLTLTAHHLQAVPSPAHHLQAVPQHQVYILQNCGDVQIGMENHMVFASDSLSDLMPNICNKNSGHITTFRTGTVGRHLRSFKALKTPNALDNKHGPDLESLPDTKCTRQQTWP